MKTTWIYAPEGPVGDPRTALAAAPRVLAGRRIEALDNGKPGAAQLLRTLGERLAARTGAHFGGVSQKGSAATPCEDELFTTLAERGDLVLTGSAD